MPKFKYRAKKISGEEIDGIQEAQDRFELARLLREKEYVLVSWEEEGKSAKEKSFISFIYPLLSIIGGVSLSEKVIFSRNLSVMLTAGLPISRALSALSRQTKNKKFQNILSSLLSSIQKGEALSVAMEAYPNIFSSLFIYMVRAGEKSGNLSDSLKLISKQLEGDLTLRRKIRGALMYPLIIVITMLVVGALMLIFVVPTLISVFKDLDVSLPTSTKIIIATSNFLTNNIILAISFVVIAAIMLFLGIRSKAGKWLIDIISLKIPFFSSLVKKLNSSRTARSLSSLMSAGVEVTEAFNITKDILQNHCYKEVLEQAKSEIQKGSPVAKVFQSAEKLYPALVGEMIAVGEETGQLSNMLLQIAVFYEEEVSDATKDLTTIIEPVLMIFIGTVVGFFAISMIQPMYSMLGGL